MKAITMKQTILHKHQINTNAMDEMYANMVPLQLDQRLLFQALQSYLCGGQDAPKY